MRKHRHAHEEHLNHEAWAIPYGDLVTLLLAFFVVMYAVSSVNEGKYRVMADAMSAAFGGPPRTLSPVQLGETQQRQAVAGRPSIALAGATSSPVHNPRLRPVLAPPASADALPMPALHSAARDADDEQLGALGTRVERALSGLVAQGLVTVRRSGATLEIQIQSDLLFASGVAVPSTAARATIEQLAAVLRDAPNAIRVEGYTDDRPIRTAQFQSNWELSAARALSVLHVLGGAGVAEPRLAAIGYGEHHPFADNATAQGRNANRRVQLVILAAPSPAGAAPPHAGAPAAVLASAGPAASTRTFDGPVGGTMAAPGAAGVH